MYVCTYVCMYVCVCVYIYIYTPPHPPRIHRLQWLLSPAAADAENCDVRQTTQRRNVQQTSKISVLYVVCDSALFSFAQIPVSNL